MNKFRHLIIQRRRPLLWIAAVTGLYALLGFVFVPWFAEKQLIDTLQQRLDANTVVEDIYFNPFTFTASIDQLEVMTADNSPLLSLRRLYTNLDPLRLFLLKVRIAEITVDTLDMHYTRYSETDDTLGRLARQWAATAEPDTEDEIIEQSDDQLFPLEIDRLQYRNGSIHYRDEVPQSGFETTLGPVNIEIANFTTLDVEEDGIKNVVVQIEQDATLTWTSNFDMTPLQFTGHLALVNFSLTTPFRYFQDDLPFTIIDGRASVDFDYVFSIDDSGPHVEINNAGMQISDLNAIENGGDGAFLSGGTLVFEDGSFVYPDMRAQASTLRMDGVNLALLRDAEGNMNVARMLSSMSDSDAEPPAPADDPDGNPLQLNVDEFVLANTTLDFTDQAPGTPFETSIRAEASLQNFTLQPDSALPFDVTLTLDSGGSLITRGTVQLFPALNMNAMLELGNLSLQPLQPYLDEIAQVTLESGDLALAAQVHSNSSESLAYQGDISLSNLRLADQLLAETLLSFETLQVNDVDFSSSESRMDISELVMDALYGRVLVNENGVTNIGQAFTPSAQATDSEAAPAPDTGDTPALAITLGRVQINSASSNFTDRSLPIVFDTMMTDLNGEISGFSSISSQPMMVNLEGQVDEYGLVQVTGELNPLDITQQTRIELLFNNLDLPAMTPYVIKFAGREIDEGTVDVALAYTIENAALQASNAVTIKNMRLGARVEYPDALDLPLDLAVALLKNGEGIIDLDVPVTGNVDDPQFSFGPVIRQAIFNVITNIVTSPFRMLGNLIGGDAEAIESIRFRPGRSDLAPPEQEKLQQLSTALGQRPQLALVIPAPIATEEDTAALKVSAVDVRIEAQLAQDESDEQLTQRRQLALENLYMTSMLMPALEELKAQFTPEADPDVDAEPIMDVLAYTADLRERLIMAEPVTEQMLQDLARARQTAIREYLTGNGEFTAERLQNQDVDIASMEDGWLNAMFEVGVIE